MGQAQLQGRHIAQAAAHVPYPRTLCGVIGRLRRVNDAEITGERYARFRVDLIRCHDGGPLSDG
jgi:hypothetical protein